MGPPQILWDPLGPPGGVPEEELKSEFNRKVARAIIPFLSYHHDQSNDDDDNDRGATYNPHKSHINP